MDSFWSKMLPHTALNRKKYPILLIFYSILVAILNLGLWWGFPKFLRGSPKPIFIYTTHSNRKHLQTFVPRVWSRIPGFLLYYMLSRRISTNPGLAEKSVASLIRSDVILATVNFCVPVIVAKAFTILLWSALIGLNRRTEYLVPRLQKKVRIVHMKNFTFSAKHVPGWQNSASDALSRFRFQDFRSLDPDANLNSTLVPQPLLAKLLFPPWTQKWRSLKLMAWSPSIVHSYSFAQRQFLSFFPSVVSGTCLTTMVCLSPLQN